MAEPWFVRAFRAEYLDVYSHRDDASAADEIAFAAEALGGARSVLDAGCGAGRHARALAARGLSVFALDLSEDLLRAAARRGGRPRYVRGDVRALPIRTAGVDAVLSLFTSFGYFDDAGNGRHVAEMRRVIRPGGTLVLDFLNAPRVRATLVPRSARTHQGTTIVEERAIREGRVEKDVTLCPAEGAEQRWRESVRLYDSSELTELLSTSGFEVRAVHGDLQGAAHSHDAPRCVLIAEAA